MKGILVLALLWAAFSTAGELNDCINQLNELHQKAQHGHWGIWAQLNPAFKSWIQASEGYLESYRFSESFLKKPTEQSQSFMYSNAVASCQEFYRDFESEMKTQGRIQMGLIGLVGVIIVILIKWI